MSDTKKNKKNAAADALTGSPTVTLKQKESDGKGGSRLVDREFELIPYEDLPRKARRELRNALFKAAPDAGSATDKADVYLSAYDAGLIALRAAGAVIDPNDDSLSAANADALDQTIMLVGLRTLGEMSAANNDESGDSKNAEEDTAGEPEKSA